MDRPDRDVLSPYAGLTHEEIKVVAKRRMYKQLKELDLERRRADELQQKEEWLKHLDLQHRNNIELQPKVSQHQDEESEFKGIELILDPTNLSTELEEDEEETLDLGRHKNVRLQTKVSLRQHEESEFMGEGLNPDLTDSRSESEEESQSIHFKMTARFYDNWTTTQSGDGDAVSVKTPPAAAALPGPTKDKSVRLRALHWLSTKLKQRNISKIHSTYVRERLEGADLYIQGRRIYVASQVKTRAEREVEKREALLRLENKRKYIVERVDKHWAYKRAKKAAKKEACWLVQTAVAAAV
ncbi:unnamed protein product [Lota lota]